MKRSQPDSVRQMSKLIQLATGNIRRILSKTHYAHMPRMTKDKRVALFCPQFALYIHIQASSIGQLVQW